MNLYHNESIHSKAGRGAKLTPIPINKTFLWEGQEMFIPAVHVGKAGAALDICAKVPAEDMIFFLKKWPAERRLSLEISENFEQFRAENPSGREFQIEMRLDGTSLKNGMSSSLGWYPPEVLRAEASAEDWENDDNTDGQEKDDDTEGQENDDDTMGWENSSNAEKLMEAYNRDRDCCWQFSRFSFDWAESPILSPQNISLTFQADRISVTTRHFSTNAFYETNIPTTIKTAHPRTGKEYTLTLHGCRQSRADFGNTLEDNMIYPEHYQELTYHISPETGHNLITIRDCAESEPARPAGTDRETDGSDGPTSVFIAGTLDTPGSQKAASALHFEPIPVVHWRIVFQIKPKEDMEIALSVPQMFPQ
ncbi:MAG: hypothetical protein HFH36_08545 [Lachnospiraceae bacterium]|nr:hypothetical protein [Lachnospiraceae bacterium]